MNKSVYVATCDPNSGKSLISLGLMSVLLGQTPKVGYFRPIIDDRKDGERDNHIATVLSHFDLKLDYDDTFCLYRSEFVRMKNEGREGEVLDLIIEKYKVLEEKCDFVLVEGTDFSGEGVTVELSTNILIAKNLGCPVILVSSGVGKEMDEFIGDFGIAYDLFEATEVDILALVANKIQPQNEESVTHKMKTRFKGEDVNVIPLMDKLFQPTVREVFEVIGGKYLFGEDQSEMQVGEYVLGAMQLRNFFTHLKNKSMVITPGDRADVILGSIQAKMSRNYPEVSGIVLTGGLIPEQPIMKLIEGMDHLPPIISTDKATFEIANEIGSVQSHIYKENKFKIVQSINSFNEYINFEAISEKLTSFSSEAMTPHMFQYQLMKFAKRSRQHIVLPEGEDPRILKAVERLRALDIVDVTLLGPVDKIKKAAQKLSINLEGIHIVDPIHSEHYDEYVETFYNLRKHKNINRAMAADIVADVSYFGTMMVYMGHADGMVSGAAHTTQNTIRPALQIIKTKPGFNTVSSIFFMCLENRVLVFGDCAINPNPNAEQLAEIAISSAKSAQAFGIEPRVAMLSYSSGSSGKGSEVEKVREATNIVRNQWSDLKLEGPIQYDAAVSKAVAGNKLPDSEVAGHATVLIFPDLNTGNNTYKAVQHETGTIAIGPMLQGLNKPVNDLSRGCTVDDVFTTVLLTAIQADQGI